jgi:hypothetical protein
MFQDGFSWRRGHRWERENDVSERMRLHVADKKELMKDRLLVEATVVETQGAFCHQVHWKALAALPRQARLTLVIAAFNRVLCGYSAFWMQCQQCIGVGGVSAFLP